jgi:predicted dienelactone hydrolase
VIYSHGNGGEGLLAYPYGELMASYGWILVAPNHTGNTAFDFLAERNDPFARVALDRPNDITAIIDAFESGLSGDELAGKADTSATLLFGHSFGGYTAFAGGGADADFDVLAADCDGADSVRALATRASSPLRPRLLRWLPFRKASLLHSRFRRCS